MMSWNELVFEVRTMAMGLETNARFLILDMCDRLERKTRDCELLSEKVAKLLPRKPVTNADRIRSMTDEELAVSLTKTVIDAICHSHGVAEASYDVPAELLENLAEEYLKWLQQPAEE